VDEVGDASRPAVGVFVRKSAFKLVLESTARRALRSEEVAGRVVVVVVVVVEAGSALVGLEVVAAAFGAARVVDEGRVIVEERTSSI
jgi:hypothetical protein